MRRLFLVLVLALLVACQQEQKGVSISSPFVGGTDGLVFDFQDFRKDVFDGGRDPFDVVVKLENKGEALVSKDDVRVRISGINPVEFGKSALDLTAFAPDDVIEMRKDPQGGVLPGPAVFVEFPGLNFKNKIAGASAQFSVRSDVCYLYSTKAVTKLCVRSNLLTPAVNGICELNEEKPLFNSGAPVQVSSFKESVRSKDKIGFTFEVKNVNDGDVFERNSECNRVDRQKENRAYVIVNSGLAGLSCTGLESTDKGAEGFVSMYGGSKIVSCTQPVSAGSDFEQLIGVDVIYDYEQTVQTNLVVKSSGE